MNVFLRNNAIRYGSTLSISTLGQPSLQIKVLSHKSKQGKMKVRNTHIGQIGTVDMYELSCSGTVTRRAVTHL